MKVTATVRGMTNLQRALKARQKKEVKSLETAVKVEGYRLMKDLKGLIRGGCYGGPEKSMIARKLSRSTTPLRRLATAVRYQVDREPFAFRFGWVGPKVSKSWKRIAARQQEGFTAPVTERQRAFFRHVGGDLSKRSKYKKYFFLKKSTSQLKTPARPILEPFWADNRERAWRHIAANYRRKLAGERI